MRTKKMTMNDSPASLGVLEVDEDPEDELDKPGTTIGTTFYVLQKYPKPVLNEIWFLTVDLFVGIRVFIAKLSEREYGWRVFEDLHSQEYIQFFDIHNCLFMRLHFSIGGYDYRRTARFRQSIPFSSFCWSCALTLRSRQQILVPQVYELMQASTYFPKVRRMLFFHAPWIFIHFWPASTMLRGHLALATLSSWERSSNFGALALGSWGSPGQIYPSEGFWSRISVWREIAFVNFTRWIGSACLCSSGE